jgi:hypothetical protein
MAEVAQMKNKALLVIIVLFLFIQLSTVVLAEEFEFDDLEIFGLEVEKLLNLGGSLLAIVLFGLTMVAYKRVHNNRFLFVAVAFLLFGIKAFLMGSEIIFGEWDWVDPVTAFMDFAILLIFFMGIVKK